MAVRHDHVSLVAGEKLLIVCADKESFVCEDNRTTESPTSIVSFVYRL